MRPACPGGRLRSAPGVILKAGLGFLTQRRKGAEDAELRSHGGPENVHLLGEPVEPRTFPHSSAFSAALRLCVFHPIAVFRSIPPFGNKETPFGRGRVPGRVGILPAGPGVPPERSSRCAGESTAIGEATTQDASLGGRDAHPTRDTPLASGRLIIFEMME